MVLLKETLFRFLVAFPDLAEHPPGCRCEQSEAISYNPAQSNEIATSLRSLQRHFREMASRVFLSPFLSCTTRIEEGCQSGLMPYGFEQFRDLVQRQVVVSVGDLALFRHADAQELVAFAVFAGSCLGEVLSVRGFGRGAESFEVGEDGLCSQGRG